MTEEHWSTLFQLLFIVSLTGGLAWVVLRMRHRRPYRSASALALLPLVAVFWVNGAVGIIGDPPHPANLLYFAVPALAGIGALLARFQAHRMSLVMWIIAGVQVVVGAASGLWDPAANPPLPTLVGFNMILVAMWAGAALLYHRAALRVARPGSNPPDSIAASE